MWMKCLGCLLLLAGLCSAIIGFIIQTGAPTKINASLTGEGHGSIGAICSNKGAAIESFTSVDFADSSPSLSDYYFYSIENPKEYLLQGANALAIERGPYSLRKYSVNYDVSFTTSRISQDKENKFGAIEYKVANAYVALDKDIDLVSSLERNTADLSLSTVRNKQRSIPAVTRRMPSYLSMSDEVTNISPAYLKVLGSAKSEFGLILSFVCTPAQINNIATASPSGGNPQCTASQLGDLSAASCACCMSDDTVQLVAHQNGGTSPNYTNCNDYFNDSNFVMGTVSLLAMYDGGVAIKTVGEEKFDGSGNTFTGTAFGQLTFHSPLLQSHSINDLMFGFPSALVARFLSSSIIPATHASMLASGITISMTQVASQVLTGALDNNLPVKVGNLANYTMSVGKVCASTCSETLAPNPLAQSPMGWLCQGKAADRDELSDPEEIALGGIDCLPFSSTFATKMYCGVIAATLGSNPGTPGFEACVCASGDDNWMDFGCCLAGGQFDGADLTGYGCLSPIPGVVDSNFAGKSANAVNAVEIDLGRAIELYVETMDTKKSTVFMCPEAGGNVPEQDQIGSYESYQEETSYITYYETNDSRIEIGDAYLATATPYNASVAGGGGTVMKGTGLTAAGGSRLITDGTVSEDVRQIYIGPARRPFDFAFYAGSRACGSSACIPTARYLQSDNYSSKAPDAKKRGQGEPFDGVQAIGDILGFPAYLHSPYFLDGDQELLSQLNNSYVQRGPGNGIKIYRGSSYGQGINSINPGIFTSEAQTGGYKLVEASWVASDRDLFDTYLDVEPATGLTMEAQLRYGVSLSAWECNPEENSACMLAVKSKGQADCYDMMGQIYFDSLDAATRAYFTSSGRNNFTYPCSAANVLTPKVVAGKIIPTYWFDTSTAATLSDVDKLVAVGKLYRKFQAIFILTVMLGLITASIGSILLCCTCTCRRSRAVVPK